MWAKNAFDEWWEFWGFDTKKSIIYVAKYEQTMMELEDMLSMSFFKLQRRMVACSHQQVMNP
jgi:hypothetical protein